MRRDVAQAAQNAKGRKKERMEWKPGQSYESHKTFAMSGNE